ncbi:hypothetical protein ACFODL_05170 [Phenylobacterium terrae]|uniref:DUF2867 domain-containing protein n=1 Tax=Phenylobacterium terrae TaxID=2665495 RepID=A0ABW4MWA5_9CAUL
MTARSHQEELPGHRRTVRPCPLPPGALLGRYAEPDGGAYTDAFVAEAPGAVSLPTFIQAFYTSRALGPELLALRLLFGKAGSKACAERLAGGEADTFSAWRVEERTASQILMREVIGGATRSWLMVEPAGPTTRLYFGSAVLPVPTRQGPPRLSPLVRPLTPFHRLYSQRLLGSALTRLNAAAFRVCASQV